MPLLHIRHVTSGKTQWRHYNELKKRNIGNKLRGILKVRVAPFPTEEKESDPHMRGEPRQNIIHRDITDDPDDDDDTAGGDGSRVNNGHTINSNMNDSNVNGLNRMDTSTPSHELNENDNSNNDINIPNEHELMMDDCDNLVDNSDTSMSERNGSENILNNGESDNESIQNQNGVLPNDSPIIPGNITRPEDNSSGLRRSTRHRVGTQREDFVYR